MGDQGLCGSVGGLPSVRCGRHASESEPEPEHGIVMEQQPELQSKTELAATKPTPLLPSKDVDFGCGHNVLVVDVVAAASASLLRHRR